MAIVIRTLAVFVLAQVLSSGSFAQQAHSTSVPQGEAALLQVVRLIGDPYTGFKRSCLLVYNDGRYHREIRRQDLPYGQLSGDWKASHVFESVLTREDFQRLKETVETEDFRKIGGIIGDPDALRRNVAFTSHGVIPHGSIEIFEAAVAHQNIPQVFEVFGGSSNPPLGSSFESVLTWVGKLEKRKDGLLPDAVANGCTTAPSSGSSWEPSTRLRPQAIYTPNPQPSLHKLKSGHGTGALQIMVNIAGTVDSASVVRGANPDLDKEAIEAVKKWRFLPAQLSGVLVPISIHVEVTFR
jgi:TonB family protein